MKNLFFVFGIVLLLGLPSSRLWADPKPSDAYLAQASSDTIKRRGSVLESGRSRSAASAPQLIAALKDKDPMTRALAAQGLGTLKAVSAEPPLAQVLATDAYPEVRQAAAVSLRQINDPEAVDALSQALGDASQNVRVTALNGLGHYRDAKVRPAVEAACQDKAPEVRRTAVFVLGRLEDPAAAPTLERLLKDSDIAVRTGAVQALGDLHAANSKPALLPLLKDPQKLIQACAARTLLMLGDTTGFELAQTLAQDPDAAVRTMAVDALGWSKNPAAETQLQALLTQAPQSERPMIQEALTRTQQLRK